ncbi:TPA: hypothetical protein ACGUW2_004640 [Vibrio vulnificus]
MSLEQQIAALVEASNNLTSAVNGKIDEIDSKVEEATRKISEGEVNQIGISLLSFSSTGTNPPLVIDQNSFKTGREFQRSFYCSGQGDSGTGLNGAGQDMWIDVLELRPSYGGINARLEFMQNQRGVPTVIDESCILRAVKRSAEEPTFLQNRDGVTAVANFRLLDDERNVVTSGSAPARYLQIYVKRYNNAWLRAVFTNII